MVDHVLATRDWFCCLVFHEAFSVLFENCTRQDLFPLTCILISWRISFVKRTCGTSEPRYQRTWVYPTCVVAVVYNELVALVGTLPYVASVLALCYQIAHAINGCRKPGTRSEFMFHTLHVAVTRSSGTGFRQEDFAAFHAQGLHAHLYDVLRYVHPAIAIQLVGAAVRSTWGNNLAGAHSDGRMILILMLQSMFCFD